MSVEAIEAVIDHSKSKGNARFVLWAIAIHADNENFKAFLSVATIAAETTLDRTTVFRNLKKLEAMGELKRVSGKEEHRPNTYKIKLKKSVRSNTKASQKAGSRHSTETIRTYVDARQMKLKNIKSIARYAAKIQQTGGADEAIDEWLKDEKRKSEKESGEKRKLVCAYLAERFWKGVLERIEPDEISIKESLAGLDTDDLSAIMSDTLHESFADRIEAETGMFTEEFKPFVGSYIKAILGVAQCHWSEIGVAECDVAECHTSRGGTVPHVN